MKEPKITITEGNTYIIEGRGLPKGCQYCLKGAKVVLFLNGRCQNPPHCAYYCPLSDIRKGKNITFADEIEITQKEELLEEIEKIDAQGMSITGGEPLMEENVEKTLEYIEYVKAQRGKEFHVHLYTNGMNVTEELMERLAKADLDEIRFHPSRKEWPNLQFALHKGISVGAEVPVIPDKKYLQELEEFILYLDQIGADFINLNEFEYCFPNSEALKRWGFELKEGSIASVKKSKKAALELQKKMAAKVSLKIHVCSILSKDYYQLRNRYLRRAKTLQRPYEHITEEGLLMYGTIEGPLEKLDRFYNLLIKELNIPPKYISYQINAIQIPLDLAIEDEIVDLLEKYQLDGYIEEIIPFRGKYCQITEKTPIPVFKEEIDIYED